jgi:ABC-type uncharacterized transport system substrate-binding protein
MKRREFITLLGGAAAWPLAARAQQPAMPVIGVLGGGSGSAGTFRIAAIKQGLKEAGYVEGQNVAIEYRWADDQNSQLPGLAAELAARQVMVIVAMGNAAALAAKTSTATIPIVFSVGSDPVQYGLVASLARPGGNVTGVTFLGGELPAKQLEVLHEAVPKSAIIGMLENPTNPNSDAVRANVGAAADSIGRKLVVAKAILERDIEPAFTTLVQQGIESLLIRSDGLFNDRTEMLVALAARHALPTIYPLPEFVLAGGLMSYGASLRDALRQAGLYTGKILMGAKPADLPVMQAVKVELAINLKTAKTFGITFPLSLLGRADEVIE